MRYKEIIESDYMKDLIKKIGPSRLKTGKPIPPNTLPSGNIKSTGTKNVGQRMDKAITKQLMRPDAKIPLPVSPNREQDFEIDKVDNDQVTLKNPRPKQGEPTTTTINQKDLEPVITNIMRRVRSQS
tara:strand:- start:1858 stop:2238 length:381 start_codon:yes stop_codon:yes gene_type:complete